MDRARRSVAAAVLAAVLILAPTTAEGQVGESRTVWDSIGVTPDSQVVYLHTRSIDRTAETAVRVWTRTRSRRVRRIYGIEYDRMLVQVEYDCDGGAVRFEWLNLYREQRLVESGRMEGRTDPLVAEELGRMLRRTLCGESGPDPG